MADTYAIHALRRKRAHLAGEIEAAQRAIGKQRATLATLDAVIRMFEPASNPELIPSIRPVSARDPLFHRGEVTRLVLSAMREAGKPVRARFITDYLLAAKGLSDAATPIKERVANKVRSTLKRNARSGTVRKIVDWPDMWWELSQ